VRIAIAIFLLLVLSGCSQPKQKPENLREKTADATAQFKSDAKALAQGVKEGWNRDRPLDLNSASKDDLLSLPGINDERAERIIAARPYREPHELVSRRILTEQEYERIKDQVSAKN